jgi:hypothetical protein
LPHSADRQASTAWLDAPDGIVEASDRGRWDTRQALLRMGIMDAAIKGGTSLKIRLAPGKENYRSSQYDKGMEPVAKHSTSAVPFHFAVRRRATHAAGDHGTEERSPPRHWVLLSSYNTFSRDYQRQYARRNDCLLQSCPGLSFGFLPARSLFKLLLAHRDDNGISLSSHRQSIPGDSH